MKVIHMPSATGGNSWRLAQGERELGIDADVYYGYGATSWLQYPQDGICKANNRIEALFELYKKAISIAKEYDIIHMNYGKSLIDFSYKGINYWDLPMYKKQKLFMTYNGCDVRQKYERIRQADICACKYDDCYEGCCLDVNVEILKKKRISMLHERGVKMFAVNPDLLNFLPEDAQFLPYAINERDFEKRREYNVGKSIKIVHAPTQRVCKGTDVILDVIDRLKKRYGNNIDFQLIEKIPNREALKMYREADLLIDQLRIGWYGGLATETMCMGIPTIAYINEEDLKYIPKEMAKDCLDSIINANEFTLYDVLENIINNPSILVQKREAGMEYINKWHNAVNVAKITKAAYES